MVRDGRLTSEEFTGTVINMLPLENNDDIITTQLSSL